MLQLLIFPPCCFDFVNISPRENLEKGTRCVDFCLLPDQESAVCHFACVSLVGDKLEPTPGPLHQGGSELLTAAPLPCLSHTNLLSNFPLYTNPCQESSER